MALVAYDNSDASDIEDEDENAPVAIMPTPNKKEAPFTSASAVKPTQNGPEGSSYDKHEQSLFNLLPRPSSKKPTVIEEDDEFLHKKETVPNAVKSKAQIAVPSLSDFRDVEDRPSARPKTTNGKKSGLLSMLPQPKNAVTATTKSLIPHILTQPKKPDKKKDPVPTTKDQPIKKANVDRLLVTNSDESDDEDVQNDFFSIHKTVEEPADGPLDIDVVPGKPVNVQSQNKRLELYFKKDTKNHVELQPDYSDYSENSSTYEGSGYDGADEGSMTATAVMEPAADNGEMVLDDEAIMKLCGSRGKRKREDIQLVDVNQQEILAGAKEMLMKGLMDDTSVRVSASKKKGNEPTGQQKRKHQITYLAHQAKANEAELQNQWANSRVSRRQTQSKYGF